MGELGCFGRLNSFCSTVTYSSVDFHVIFHPLFQIYCVCWNFFSQFCLQEKLSDFPFSEWQSNHVHRSIPVPPLTYMNYCLKTCSFHEYICHTNFSLYIFRFHIIAIITILLFIFQVLLKTRQSLSSYSYVYFHDVVLLLVMQCTVPSLYTFFMI